MISLQKARQIRAMIEKAATSLSDEDALVAPEMFPQWDAATAYAVDDRVRYNCILYKCLTAHTAQSDWTPDVAPSLWVNIAEPGTIPEWKQPTGATDAYMLGDKVHHVEKTWESLVNNNVWEPGATGTEYLWKEI